MPKHKTKAVVKPAPVAEVYIPATDGLNFIRKDKNFSHLEKDPLTDYKLEQLSPPTERIKVERFQRMEKSSFKKIFEEIIQAEAIDEEKVFLTQDQIRVFCNNNVQTLFKQNSPKYMFAFKVGEHKFALTVSAMFDDPSRNMVKNQRPQTVFLGFCGVIYPFSFKGVWSGGSEDFIIVPAKDTRI